MYSHFLKRILDFLIVFCVLAIIWPILLLLIIWLYFANKGAGVFFMQQRPGKKVRYLKLSSLKR